MIAAVRTPTRPRIRPVRLAGWLALVLVLELVTRALVYSLAPTPAQQFSSLGAVFGGPRPVVVALVAVGLALVLSVGVLWLAAIGTRERWALSAPGEPAPRVPAARALARGAFLTVATWLTFAAIESYLHWRAGLGFHGLGCLWGPVHVNAMPVAAGLSILAAGALTAAQHLLRWMRRVVRRLLSGHPSGRRRHPNLIVVWATRAIGAVALPAAAFPRPPPAVV